MSYAFPEEYDRFMDCFEKNADEARQEKVIWMSEFVFKSERELGVCTSACGGK
jgi:hypothetical protein